MIHLVRDWNVEKMVFRIVQQVVLLLVLCPIVDSICAKLFNLTAALRNFQFAMVLRSFAFGLLIFWPDESLFYLFSEYATLIYHKTVFNMKIIYF